MKNYMCTEVVCPFYSQEQELKLHCEGYCKGTRLHICFDRKERKKAHKKLYCNSLNGYKDCPLYPVILEQYQRKEADSDENE